MRWPPIMSWTSLTPYKGEFYFVAVSYGIRNSFKWIDLVSVLYGEISLRVPYEDLNDSSKWQPGWIAELNNSDYDNEIKNIKKVPLISPSIDSGLSLPLQNGSFRPWCD